MNKNYRRIINIGIIIIITIVLVPAAYKTNKSHRDKLYSSLEAKIIETALKCYNKEECENKKITLQELYDKEYLEKVINPLNNEYINPNSYIEIVNAKEGIFILIDE